jgi:hypothetical protein
LVRCIKRAGDGGVSGHCFRGDRYERIGCHSATWRDVSVWWEDYIVWGNCWGETSKVFSSVIFLC